MPRMRLYSSRSCILRFSHARWSDRLSWLCNTDDNQGLSQSHIPSIVERSAERPAAVKDAPLSWRGVGESFTARTRSERIANGRKGRYPLKCLNSHTFKGGLAKAGDFTH
jgi:hypothetical protein